MNKRKKLIPIIILAAMVLGITGIVRYNYEMYDSDIARVVDADNKEDDSGEEPRYTQKLTLKIKNHEHKGEVYVTENSFFYSQMDTTEYKKGDIVFVYMSEKNGEMSVVVNKLKRDDYAVFLTGLFCIALFVTEEKRGLLILGTLIVQIAVFVYSLQFFLKEEDILRITLFLAVGFILFTMIFLNGICRKSLAAVLASLITIFIIFGIYSLAYFYGERPVFELMEYTKGNEDFSALFFASVLFGCLGAVMDVTITICATADEYMKKQTEDSKGSLKESMHEVGKDIMGTMVNVLFFSYLSGSVPWILVKMLNQYTFSSILNYDIIFELLRFLVGAIGIVVAIPVSECVVAIFYSTKNFLRER